MLFQLSAYGIGIHAKVKTLIKQSITPPRW